MFGSYNRKEINMGYVRIIFFLSIVSTHVLALTIAQPPMLYKDCLDRGNYTTNSTYQENLNHLLNSVYTNTEISYGFYNFSYGKNPDAVSAIALCRPDISPDTCRACIKNASISLQEICPTFKEAVGGYDNCMLRYANRSSIFNQMEAGPYFFVYGPTKVSNVTGFNQARMTLLDMLSDKAASGNSRYKYAEGNFSAPNSQNIYALVQCTPDLSTQQCRDCLTEATKLIPKCCNEREGGRVITPSCNFRYETSLFYASVEMPTPETSSPSSPSPSPPPTSTSARSGEAGNLAGALIIGALSVLLF